MTDLSAVTKILKSEEDCCLHSAVITWLYSNTSLQRQEVENARSACGHPGERELVTCIAKLGLVAERDLALAYHFVTNLPLFDGDVHFKAQLPKLEISMRFLRQYFVVPLQEQEKSVLVLFANPLDNETAEALAFVFGKKVEKIIGSVSEVARLLDLVQGLEVDDGAVALKQGNFIGSKTDVEKLRDRASEEPVIKFVNHVLQRAVTLGASDIHIEPFEDELMIRCRVDGLLRRISTPPLDSAAAVISRVKIMAELDIAERRLPQDGRFMTKVEGGDVDVRVSTVPTSHGESMVLRLLERSQYNAKLSALGISESDEEAMKNLLTIPNGIILVTGPTGSGKTTTLYSALRSLNNEHKKIITAEDPIEYQIKGVNQIQVKPDIGLTFPTVLRSIVRQDPDVILIGEMRDLETARIAIQSSLTGHLVLSTLHTNSSTESITRLVDMGVERFLLASSMKAVLAQRLVRKLNTNTAEKYSASAETIERFGLDKITNERPICLYRPRDLMDENGYSGRFALTELLIVSEQIASAISAGGNSTEILRLAKQQGMKTLLEAGLRSALAGLTSLEEVIRVVGEQ